MAEWFYLQDQQQKGPVPDSELLALRAQGVIQAGTLVWDGRLDSGWVRLDAAGLDLPPRPLAVAGPVPSFGPADSPATTPDEAFLTCPLTVALIGDRSDTYLAKWRKGLQKARDKGTYPPSFRSFNGAAFLVPFAWPFYRKLWGLGAAVWGIMFLILLLPERFDASARAVGMGVGIAVSLFADQQYYRAVLAKWEELRALPDQAEAEMLARRDGGTSLAAALGAGFGLFIVGIASVLLLYPDAG